MLSGSVLSCMSTLLVQSCSASKNRMKEPTPAMDVYSGYFFKIIKKAAREQAMRDDLDIRILSAKYGLLDPEDCIEYYDQKMDRSRAAELRDSVITDIETQIDKYGYSRIVVNLGEPYKKAIEGLDQRVDPEVLFIEGDGIGNKGHELKRFIRGRRESGEAA